jgi:hypothetical protein
LSLDVPALEVRISGDRISGDKVHRMAPLVGYCLP